MYKFKVTCTSQKKISGKKIIKENILFKILFRAAYLYSIFLFLFSNILFLPTLNFLVTSNSTMALDGGAVAGIVIGVAIILGWIISNFIYVVHQAEGI